MNASSDERDSIYLDHAAATPLRQEVRDVMLPFLGATYGNPSSIHHKGREAHGAILRAREDVATALRAHPHEIIFTGSGTEANNLALFGVLRSQHDNKKHILVSRIEHKSVLAPADALTREGYDVEYVPVPADGRVRVDDVVARVRKDTALISIMYANNEIGTVEPIGEIAEALKKTFTISGTRPLFHTDACQAPGQLPVDVTDLGVDLMTLNGSKMYGPKGTGLLYVRSGVTLLPHILGGEQENGTRGGTENVAGIVGLAKALTLAVAEREDTTKKLTILREKLIAGVMRAIPNAVLNGHRAERLANNVHLSFPHIEGESLVLLLDAMGICAGTGSACSAHDLTPSHVLRAIGQNHELIHGSIRLSLGRETTEADVTKTITALEACVARLTALSPLPLSL